MRRNKKCAHINEQINILLLSYDRISGSTEIATRLLDKVNLLEWKVWLEERVLQSYNQYQQPLLMKYEIEGHTFPNRSSGRPRYAMRLFLSLVRSDVAFDSVGARAARGGEPLSSRY